jgi:hypothetical protein
MAASDDKISVELLKQAGATAGFVALFPVPASHKDMVQGVQLACIHIAEKGTGVPENKIFIYPNLKGVRVAFCKECDTRQQAAEAARAAKAGN